MNQIHVNHLLNTLLNSIECANLLQMIPKKEESKPKSDATSAGAPSVDYLNSSVPVEPPKSTIGIRKVQPRRGVSIEFIDRTDWSVAKWMFLCLLVGRSEKRRFGCDESKNEFCRSRESSQLGRSTKSAWKEIDGGRASRNDEQCSSGVPGSVAEGSEARGKNEERWSIKGQANGATRNGIQCSR